MKTKTLKRPADCPPKWEWLQWIYQQSRQREGIEAVRVRREYD